MKRLLREPLVYFVLLGGLLFGLDAVLSEQRLDTGGGDIVVTEGRIASLAAVFMKTWERPPTPAELRGLIDAFVLEEALYREAKNLGLDRDDTIVRRRMRQKMEFVVDDILEMAEPPEEELAKWLADHPEAFALPNIYSFRHVFLNPERRGETLARDAAQMLKQLRAENGTADPRELGDPMLLAPAYADARADTIGGIFGAVFSKGLAELPIGEWSGPVESAFGQHLVMIDAMTKGRVPELAEVRASVDRELRFARREEAKKKFYAEVIGRYNVTIERPQVGDEEPSGEKPAEEKKGT